MKKKVGNFKKFEKSIYDEYVVLKWYRKKCEYRNFKTDTKEFGIFDENMVDRNKRWIEIVNKSEGFVREIEVKKKSV